MRAKITQVPQ